MVMCRHVQMSFFYFQLPLSAHAPISIVNFSMAGMRCRPRHCLVMALSSFSDIFSQLPSFRAIQQEDKSHLCWNDLVTLNPI